MIQHSTIPPICSNEQEKYKELLTEKNKQYHYKGSCFIKNLIADIMIITAGICIDAKLSEENEFIGLIPKAIVAKIVIGQLLAISYGRSAISKLHEEVTELNQKTNCITEAELKLKCGLNDSFEFMLDGNLIPTNLPLDCNLD